MREREKTAYSSVSEFDPDDLLNKSTEDLADIVFAHAQIRVPALLREQELLSTPVEASHKVSDYGSRPVTVQGMEYELRIPFDGDSELFYLQPNTSISLPPNGNIIQRHLVLRVAGEELDVDETKKQFEKTLAQINNYLRWQTSDAGPFNTRVRAEAVKRIDARKQTILDSRKIAASLGYRMQPTLSYPTHKAPHITRKPTPVGRSSSPQKFVSEPELIEEDYQHILGIIEAMSHVMERSPRSFAHLDEEDLRQHLLVPLNGHYKGEGTAEAFNSIGKTDILIRVEDKNIFIAECKVWGGEKILTGAIDQLQGYLTWRDTKSALIIFSHAKDFTAMLKTMWAGIEAHPHFKRQERVEGDTRRRYVFRSKLDPDRELFMTALAFNIPK
jgi:hypothetical protein